MTTDETITDTPDPEVAPEMEGDAPEVDEAAAEPEAGAGDDTPVEGQQEEDDDEPLISPEEREALKNNPAALEKALRRAFHAKTTNLKAERQALQRAAEFVQWAQENPQKLLRALAAQQGIKLPEEPDKQQAADLMKQAMDQTFAEISEAAGPDVARALVPAMQRIVQSAVSQSMAPVKQFHESQAKRVASEQAASTIAAFKAKHDDYPKLEPAMVELSKKFPPADGVDQREYLEGIYQMAKARSGAATVEVAKRMAKSVAASSSPAKGQSTEQSVSPPSAPRSMTEAFTLAKRGVRL